jgi:hypothetical protein
LTQAYLSFVVVGTVKVRFGSSFADIGMIRPISALLLKADIRQRVSEVPEAEIARPFDRKS